MLRAREEGRGREGGGRGGRGEREEGRKREGGERGGEKEIQCNQLKVTERKEEEARGALINKRYGTVIER